MHVWWHIEPTETIKYWKDKARKFGGAYAGEVERRMQPGFQPQPSVQEDINRFIGSQAKGLGGAIQRGALAVQEGVVDPMLDRVMGTAPGIPVRPFFGGESGGPPAQPQRPSTPVGPRSVADIVRNFETPASIGFTMPPSTPVGASPAAVPSAAVAPTAVPTALPPAVEAQFQALQ